MVSVKNIEAPKTPPKSDVINNGEGQSTLRHAFTTFIGRIGAVLTKSFHQDKDGNIIKNSQPKFSHGQAVTKYVNNLHELTDTIDSLGPNQCISTGVFVEDECDIAPVNAPKGSNTKSRTKSNMFYPKHGVLMFDYDENQFTPEELKCASVEAVMNRLAKAIPGLEDMAYAGSGSSSQGVYASDGETRYKSNGFHIYIFCNDIDLNQFKKYLEAKLWNADEGYISFSRNGAKLLRTLIDITVLSQERLIYEATPILGEGLEKEPRVWVRKEGEVLTGDFTLSDKTAAQAKRLTEKAKNAAEVCAKSDEFLARYIEVQTPLVAEKNNISLELARKCVQQRTGEKSNQSLYLPDVIDINSGESITVRDLLSRHEEFNGKSLPDPNEGIAYGKGTATFYYNGGYGPCIHSHAHGQSTVYQIFEFGFVETTKVYVDRCEVKASGKPVAKSSTLTRKCTSHDLNQPLDPEGFPDKRIDRGGIRLKETIPNLEHLLQEYGITIFYDVIGKRTVINIPGLQSYSDNIDNVVLANIISLVKLNDIGTTQLGHYLEAVANKHLKNPAADWITSEPWDRNDRLEALYSAIHHQKDYPEGLKKTLVLRWLISAVAVLFDDDARTRGVLTLQGPQSVGKTAFVMSLVPDSLQRSQLIKVDHHLDPSNKDSIFLAISHWITEIGELDSSFKKDIAAIKGFLTRDRDKLRRPYAKGESSYKRRTVFIATVNGCQFLVDDTGNTRWWTVAITNINYQHGINMQQLWAQVHELYKEGEQWWLTDDEEAQLEQQNKYHRQVSTIRQQIMEELDTNIPKKQWVRVSASGVLKALGYNTPKNTQSKECAAVLRELFGQSKRNRGYDCWLVPPILGNFEQSFLESSTAAGSENSESPEDVVGGGEAE